MDGNSKCVCDRCSGKSVLRRCINKRQSISVPAKGPRRSSPRFFSDSSRDEKKTSSNGLIDLNDPDVDHGIAKDSDKSKPQAMVSPINYEPNGEGSSCDKLASGIPHPPICRKRRIAEEISFSGSDMDKRLHFYKPDLEETVMNTLEQMHQLVLASRLEKQSKEFLNSQTTDGKTTSSNESRQAVVTSRSPPLQNTGEDRASTPTTAPLRLFGVVMEAKKDKSSEKKEGTEKSST